MMPYSGLTLRVSAFLPDFSDVPSKPRNRREARKRAVITARRRRQGRPIPVYTSREPCGCVMCVGSILYCSPSAFTHLKSLR